ncbi:MAG TPA: STAS domain-containing protein [Steroidobacteraceae bacterium]|nr:STAS domain-containing protein [Steroidobacteraceae bacterium]
MSGPAVGAAGAAAAPAAAFEIVVTSPGQFAARGALNFANARAARSEGLHALRTSSARDLEVDCSGITHSDSAGLAVLLDWLALMKREGRPLCFVNLPSGLLAVARIGGVEDMLKKCV